MRTTFCCFCPTTSKDICLLSQEDSRKKSRKRETRLGTNEWLLNDRRTRLDNERQLMPWERERGDREGRRCLWRQQDCQTNRKMLLSPRRLRERNVTRKTNKKGDEGGCLGIECHFHWRLLRGQTTRKTGARNDVRQRCRRMTCRDEWDDHVVWVSSHSDKTKSFSRKKNMLFKSFNGDNKMTLSLSC